VATRHSQHTQHRTPLIEERQPQHLTEQVSRSEANRPEIKRKQNGPSRISLDRLGHDGGKQSECLNRHESCPRVRSHHRPICL
jgi:hypothetical protein